MTAHQAKGKEFDAVVLVNATAAHFPDSDEGRRLFYVAITRASKAWTIPLAGQPGGHVFTLTLANRSCTVRYRARQITISSWRPHEL